MQDIRYMCKRSDFVAVTRAMVRRSFWHTALKIVLSLIAAGGLFMMAWLSPVEDGVRTWYAEIIFRFWAILFLPLLLVIFGDQLAGVIAALVFKTRAAADKEIIVTLSDNGIHVRSADIDSNVSWRGITKAIETKTHMFLALSKREALRLVRKHLDVSAPFVRHEGFRIIDLKKA